MEMFFMFRPLLSPLVVFPFFDLPLKLEVARAMPMVGTLRVLKLPTFKLVSTPPLSNPIKCMAMGP
eukprot:3727986-Pleurochrysis_carterae.AAC.1